MNDYIQIKFIDDRSPIRKTSISDDEDTYTYQHNISMPTDHGVTYSASTGRSAYCGFGDVVLLRSRCEKSSDFYF